MMSSYRYKARPTIYNGIQMRSRLEARYAAHLDAKRATWEYEPSCFASPKGQYLPDFLINGSIYVELKPISEWPNRFDHLERMHIIRASVMGAALVVRFGDRDNFSAAVRCIEGDWCNRCLELDAAIEPPCDPPIADPRAAAMEARRALDAVRNRPPHQYKVNQVILHKKWGAGRVTAVDGGDRVTVMFLSVGEKHLSTEWAPMVPKAPIL